MSSDDEEADEKVEQERERVVREQICGNEFEAFFETSRRRNWLAVMYLGLIQCLHTACKLCRLGYIGLGGCR